MRQLPLAVQLRASSVFASFFRGPNQDVVEQLMSLVHGPQLPAVWLCGPLAVGKTHLLQALCAQAGQQNLSAAYFPLSDSTLAPEMLIGCESLSAVCLDDFDRVAGRTDWERAVFRLYTELEDAPGRLVIAAAAPPASINVELKDLASRLAVSTLLRIKPLNDEQQCAALTLRAEQLGLELSEDVAHWLQRRLPRDMSSLCDALDTLDRASLVTQRRLTVSFVRTVMENRTL